MITHCRVYVERDADTLFELHSQANYAVASPWLRSATTYEQFRDHWLTTPQPEEFLASLTKSLKDPRTVAEIWEVDGGPAGFVWVRFTDVTGYDFTRADVDDLAVAPEFRRMGIGSQMMAFAEEAARTNGANALYIETGWENDPARSLYVKRGFRERYLGYEMLFRRPDSLRIEHPDP